jgi:hypothetical protein
MLTVFEGKIPYEAEDKFFWWRERVFLLNNNIHLVRFCDKNKKLEVNYIYKPKEWLQCTDQEFEDIVQQIRYGHAHD